MVWLTARIIIRIKSKPVYLSDSRFDRLTDFVGLAARTNVLLRLVKMEGLDSELTDGGITAVEGGLGQN